MTMETFIQAMPKVELHVHLEGAWHKDTLMMIAEENEVRGSLKHFDNWVKLLDRPDFNKLDELNRVVAQWFSYEEDLTRIVYDLGVSLYKQNVRYAEVSVTPSLYAHMGLPTETIFTALNDGRDRVQRAWGVKLAWILTLSRDEPRRGDEILRYAGTVAGKRAGVVGMGLAGRENAQPVGQFERLFKNAEKKDIPRVLHAGDVHGVDAVLDTIKLLNPTRIVEGWGAADAPDVLTLLTERGIPLDVSMARALVMNVVSTYAEYPLRHLYNAGVTLVLGTDMPSYYKTTLSNEYLAAVEHAGLTIDELQDVALNAVRASLLPDDEKRDMLDQFTKEYASLREEHMQTT